MKRVVSILCVAVLLVSMMALAGCGIDGTYKMVSQTENGKTTDAAALEESGTSYTLTIKGETGTMTITYGDQSNTTPLTVDTKNKLIIGGGEAISYTTSGKTLILQKNGDTMTFEKQ